MNKTIDLTPLYPLQAELDKDIAIKHGVTYESTNTRRMLALLVEIGELANETRSFKYWSNKKDSPRDVILEEYSDGMHFFLSLGIPLKINKMIYELNNRLTTLSDSILNVYCLIVDFVRDNSEINYITAFQSYLDLLIQLDITPDEAIKAYKGKLDINYKRQQNAY